jgi:hypothetical protein
MKKKRGTKGNIAVLKEGNKAEFTLNDLLYLYSRKNKGRKYADFPGFAHPWHGFP